MRTMPGLRRIVLIVVPEEAPAACGVSPPPPQPLLQPAEVSRSAPSEVFQRKTRRSPEEVLPPSFGHVTDFESMRYLR